MPSLPVGRQVGRSAPQRHSPESFGASGAGAGWGSGAGSGTKGVAGDSGSAIVATLEGSRPLLPPMPWPNFANMPDADISAIYAYLMSTAPVENVVPAPVPPNEL